MNSRVLNRSRILLFLVAGAGVLVIAASGQLYRAVQARAEMAARQELAAIADLKLTQIATWREERLADAAFFSRALGVAGDLGRFLESPTDAGAEAAVLDWMRLLKRGDRYEAVILYDSELVPRKSIPAGATETAHGLQSLAEQVTATGEVAAGDLQHHGDMSRPRIRILAPIYRDPVQRSGAPLGYLLLRIDPTSSLFVLTGAWPTSSATAETLLVRRDGDDVLYLTELRHLPDAALVLRRPLNSPLLPAARVLRGETDAYEGIDYRGVPVVWVGRRLPGTPWAMIAKVDKAELYADAREHAFLAGLVGVSLLLAALLAVNLLWRQRSSRLNTQLRLQAAALKSAVDGIVITRVDGTIEWVNPGFTHLTGYAEHEVLGRTPAVLRSGRQSREFYRQMWETILSGRPWRGELVNRRRDGSLYHESMTITPVRDEDGGLARFIAIKHDITARKESEEMQSRMRAELEELVTQRTAALRETVEALETFSYSITHDMRAPLRAMNTYAVVLARRHGAGFPPEVHELLERIRTSATRLDHLIRDSLDYSKAMRSSFPRRAVDVGPLLRAMIDSYPNFQPPEAEITVEFDSLLVMGDEAALTQCFSNLIGNGVKFVAPGVMPRVHVFAESTMDAEGAPLVRVSVADNGIGIPAEAHEKIFELFARLHSANEYPGTGVGLALVRKLVQRMSGSVGMRSTPGEGSVFWIELGQP